MELMQKLKRFARPRIRYLGEVFRKAGTEIIRRTATGQLEQPLYTRYPGVNPGTVDCRIAYNEHGGYCIPLSSFDRPAAQKIFRGKVYEHDTIKYIREVCGEGDIVHAGTFFGDFLPPLSNSSAERIWAFEPNPVNYRCALATIGINGLSNIELENAALGDDSGTASLAVRNEQGRALGGNSTVTSSETELGKATVEIPLARIDDAIPTERKVSVLQLDVEGYEKHVLSGGLETIRRCLPVLILERPPNDTWMKDNILSIGYEYAGKVANNTVLHT